MRLQGAYIEFALANITPLFGIIALLFLCRLTIQSEIRDNYYDMLKEIKAQAAVGSSKDMVKMKKLFVIADVHSFYEEMLASLKDKGFDRDDPDHIFVLLGDLLDRGPAPKECLSFVNSLPNDRKILIRGNHEDLLEECLTRRHFSIADIHNGTMDTVRILAGENHQADSYEIFSTVRSDPMLSAYLSALRDYAEIGDYVFVHGWIPSRKESPGKDWRKGDWQRARWFNGMEKWKQGARLSDKTILCGHWHTSWGHSVLEKKGTEFGAKADFSPFIQPGIVALDACTVYSHRVNCFVIEM